MADTSLAPMRKQTDCSRRSSLGALATVVRAASTARVLGSGAALVGLSAELLAAATGPTSRQEALIQPSAIRSEYGVLETLITAAPGKVQFGEFAVPGLPPK